jgi:beta-galactosidase GanA
MAISRRNFIQGAAGVSLAWGGLRMFAGEPGAMGEPGTGQGAAQASEFIYGTQFYRPPNPPRGERRRMLKDVAQKYGFNIIRIYPMWDYYNREPGKFDFSEIDEVMKYADEFGLKVLMGIVFETAPYWLEQANPEARFVDAKGQPQRLEGSGAQMTGGWPGLCLDWAPVRDAAEEFVRQLCGVVKQHPSLYAYDCWNEPHIEPAWQRNIWATPQEKLYCYCTKTIEKFQAWLEKKYGTIEKLNEAWTRGFPDFKAIDAPRSMGTYADWVDWRRYIVDRSTKYMHFRAGAVKAVDDKHVMESHGAHHPPVESGVESGTNAWRLAEVVDVWGLSLFPRRWNAPGISERWMQAGPGDVAAKFEITRSNAAGKDFWLTELQGGHSNRGLYRGPQMRPQDIRTYNWLAVATGARGIIYWAYLAESTGSEATGFGLVTRDGETTDRADEAAVNKRLIQMHWDILKEYKPRPQVAILTDQDNAILAYAMSGNEEVSTKSFKGYYKALWNMDLWADFIEPASIAKSNYKVIIAPWHLIGKKETCEALRRFVEAGGTLIVESSFGLFDERFFANPVVPPWGLDEAFGYKEQESLMMNTEARPQPMPPSDAIYYEPEIAFTAPMRVGVKANTYLTPIAISSATPIATCEGKTVAAMKKAGKGTVYYIGTNLGASITGGSRGGVELLRAMIAPLVGAEATAEKVRPRLIEGAKQSLLVVFNESAEEQSDLVALKTRYRKATNIHSGKEVAVGENGIRVTVPYQDVVVFLLEL